MQRIKLFTTSSSWGKPASQFSELENTINAWLSANPGAVIDRAHQLSQPSFGWGQLSIAVWYHESADSAE